jgi:hypothetical protein
VQSKKRCSQYYQPAAQVPWLIALQLGLLHRTWLGQLLAQTCFLRWYFRWSSAQLGRKYDAPDSRKLIPRFIQVSYCAACNRGDRHAACHPQVSCSMHDICVQEYAVDTSEIERPVEEYCTLNDFFARRLCPGARPIHRQTCAHALWIKATLHAHCPCQ